MRLVIPHRKGPGIKSMSSTSNGTLFGALVDLGQEGLEDLLLKATRLIDGGDLGAQFTNNVLFVLLVELLQLELVEDSLDLGLVLLVLATVGGVEDSALLRSGALDGLVNQPRALVVLDVGSDLANDLRVAEVVQVVILDLEVLTQRDQNIVSLLKILLAGQLQVVQSKSDRQVEAVVGGLVGNNEHVLLQGEVVKVHIVLRGSDQVTKLTQLSLPGGLVEELDQVNVGGVGAEALLEDEVDGCFEHEGIVDGNETNTLLAVPAGLTTTGDGAVHNVIAHQEEGLEKLGEPTQDAQVLELFIGEGLLQEGKTSVGNREASVQFATGGVSVERLSIEYTG